MPRNLPRIVHCLYEKCGNQWQAFTLEFGLAAQADSFEEASRKLDAMVRTYVYDATEGEDREHADVLLNRRATASVYRKYYATLIAKFLRDLFGGHDGSSRSVGAHPLTSSAHPA